MLSQDDLTAIGERYHRADWDGFQPTQAVFDIGALVGHALALAERNAVLVAAARAVVEQVTEPDLDGNLCSWCAVCGAPFASHQFSSCSLGALAALLERDDD